MPGVIVPRKTVGELAKLLDGGDEKRARGSMSDSRIEFRFSDVTLSSKLIDGTFPDYERVIPTANDKSMTVDKATFAQAVDRVSTIASAESRAVKLARVLRAVLNLSANSHRTGGRRTKKSTLSTAQPTSKSASTPATCSTSRPSSRAMPRSSCLPTLAPQRWSRTRTARLSSTS